MASKTTRILFSGRVQGVGFRWATERIARNYQVTGLVRNLMTGQVEMIACGESATVEELISAVCERFQANIDAIEREEMPEQTEFSDFRIQR